VKKKPRPWIARGEFRGVDVETTAKLLHEMAPIEPQIFLPLPPNDVLQITETDMETGRRSIREITQPRDDVLRITETDEDSGSEWILEIAQESPLGRPRGRRNTHPRRVIADFSQRAHEDLARALHAWAQAKLGRLSNVDRPPESPADHVAALIFVRSISHAAKHRRCR